jgi:hypothetical protein
MRSDLPDFVTSYIDRHGKKRFRFRHPHLPSSALPDPCSPDFPGRYDAAMRGEITPSRSIAESRRQAEFSSFCERTARKTASRAKERSLEYDLDAPYLSALLAGQKWRCAISGIELYGRPRDRRLGSEPFAPGIDRIRPGLGYVRGNVRIVCNIANFAMNQWGEEVLWEFVRAMSKSRTEGRAAAVT